MWQQLTASLTLYALVSMLYLIVYFAKSVKLSRTMIKQACSLISLSFPLEQNMQYRAIDIINYYLIVRNMHVIHLSICLTYTH